MTATFPPATAIDLDLAVAFYAVLVRQARKGTPISSGEVVVEAKAHFPDNAAVQKAIAVSVGRRLDIIRAFTQQRELPDLCALVVNKATRGAGTGPASATDTQQLREQIAAFDWDSVAEDFAADVAAARETVAAPKVRVSKPRALTYDQAAAQMSAYYMANKDSLPAAVRSNREAIIQRIRDGRTVEEAFAGTAKTA